MRHAITPPSGKATFGDDKGRQWWVTVNPDTGKAKLVIGRAGCASERFDLDNATRLALVRALSGVGD